MSDLFEDDDMIDVEDVEPELNKTPLQDARIRLEKKLDEKRLRDELNDFFDY